MIETNAGEYATARAASAAGTIMVCYYIITKDIIIQSMSFNLSGVWSSLIRDPCIPMSLVEFFSSMMFSDTIFMGYFQC